VKTAVQEVTFQLTTPDGEPASGDLLAAYPDGRYLTGQTRGGVVSLKLYRTDVQMTVLAAADGCLPFHADVTPGEAQTVTLDILPSPDDRQALIFTPRGPKASAYHFTRSTGYIPGIEGRLRPHREADGRHCLYTDNIAVNGQAWYPCTPFEVGDPLELLDVYGVETTVRFLVVEEQFSLVEYTVARTYDGEKYGVSYTTPGAYEGTSC
jgi:hypothetical protein